MKRMNTGTIRKSLFMIATAVMIMTSLPVAAWAAEDTFVAGTTINGIDVGNMKVSEAREKIRSTYASSYTLTLNEKNGITEVITGPEIGYTITIPDNYQSLLDTQNAGGRISGPAADNIKTLPVTASYDAGMVEVKLKALNCFVSADITATSDAYISKNEESGDFFIAEEVYGNNLDYGRTLAAVKNALAAGSFSVDLEADGCYVAPSILSSDESLNALLQTMNDCKTMEITYHIRGQEEILSGSQIATWIRGTETDGQIAVDPASAAAYIASLAQKYDTAGTIREFASADSRIIPLTGPYGWNINQAGESAALIAMIRTGQTQTRECTYVQAAANGADFSLPDWGNTYVEVDLLNQHAYMYQAGVLVWDAPFVSGNVAAGHATPAGIYSLTYKQTDRILRGAKQADGTYEYESHVNYWMPFNGGIGLHDAAWRSKFGGGIYQNSGSHGCINLPSDRTRALYDLVYSGIPVICHN